MYKVLNITFLIIFFLGCNHSPSLTDKFTLTLDISGVLEEDTYLVKREFGKWVNIDSSNSKTGIIEMGGSISEPEFYYLKFGKTYIGIFLEPGNIVFKAHVDSLDNNLISGSQSNEELNLFQTSIITITNDL